VLAATFVTRAGVEVLARDGEAARVVVDSVSGFVPRAAEPARQMVSSAQRLYQNVDRNAAPLDARFWYNTGSTGQARPAPGRVSLVLPIFRPCVGGCLSITEAASRIGQRFNGQPLDITFRTRTFGFYLDVAPVTPAEEAEYTSRYLLEDVGLPGALAIAETQYSFLPDGRRSDQPTTDAVNHPGASVMIVDRTGTIRYVASQWNAVLESRITRLIEELLNE
jgi:hypothetical protein